MEYTVKVVTYDNPTDPRLGRNVVHDSRSLNYQVDARDPKTLKSVRHLILIPVLNQGRLGSCTGNAGTHDLASDEHWPVSQKFLSTTDNSANQKYAVRLYSDATSVDPWQGQYPPTDTGSDGLSIAKVLKARGVISEYRHATSLEATLTALSEGPVMVGTNWLEGMFSPAADGRLPVTGNIAGGHEYVLDELDVERQRVWIHNSWGDSWGLSGRAWMTWDELGGLLSDNGDCTVLIPAVEPPPFPDPDEPVEPLDEVVLEMREASVRMMNRTDCPNYFRKRATRWIASSNA